MKGFMIKITGITITVVMTNELFRRVIKKTDLQHHTVIKYIRSERRRDVNPV